METGGIELGRLYWILVLTRLRIKTLNNKKRKEKMLLEQETRDNLEKVFQEINDFLQQKVIKGLSAFSPADMDDIRKFKERLETLKATNLMEYFSNLLDKIEKVQASRSEDNQMALIDEMLKVLTFTRVYERVMSKEIVLNELETAQQQYSSLQQKKDSEKKPKSTKKSKSKSKKKSKKKTSVKKSKSTKSSKKKSSKKK